jgi:3-oxoacyl-[acyl-carrier-protein] synthase III
MRTDGVFLAGIGAHVPPSMPTAEAVSRGLYSQAALDSDGWTGASIAGDTPAPDLAVMAGRQAVSQSGLSPDEFAMVLHASAWHQGPDGWSAAHYVQRHTVAGTAPAMEIRQACNGMLGSMELAVAYLAVSDRPAVLITGAENFGAPLVDRWRYSEGSGTNRGSILGDAGTAVVLSRRPGFARLLAIRSMSLPETEEMYRGDEALFPPGCTIGTPMRVGARFAQFAKREPEIFSAAKSRLHEARTVLAVGTLADAAVKPGDVTRATHVFSGGAKYVESVLGPVGIDPARGMLDFGRGVGHLGVNDHIAGLSHLLATRAVGPGDIVLMLGNGSGISLSCAVIEIL